MPAAVFINTADTPIQTPVSTDAPSATPSNEIPLIAYVDETSCVDTTSDSVTETTEDVTRCFYCEINTRNLVISDPLTVEKTWVRVDTLPPSSMHIVNSLGEWYLPDTTPETIDAVRRELYLKAWPVYKQLEAYQDALLGDTTKLTRMKEDFDMIRLQYPK